MIVYPLLTIAASNKYEWHHQTAACDAALGLFHSFCLLAPVGGWRSVSSAGGETNAQLG